MWMRALNANDQGTSTVETYNTFFIVFFFFKWMMFYGEQQYFHCHCLLLVNVEKIAIDFIVLKHVYWYLFSWTQDGKVKNAFL